MSLATHCYFITMSHLSIRGSPSDGEYFRESEKNSAVLECTHLTLFILKVLGHSHSRARAMRDQREVSEEVYSIIADF